MLVPVFRIGIRREDKNEWERRVPLTPDHVADLGTFVPPGDEPLATRLARRLSIEPGHAIVERLRWAGLPADEPAGDRDVSPLDVLARRLEKKMAYRQGERDMVVLRHEIEVRAANETERRVSLLVAYGEPAGDSAIARRVSLPATVGARLLLDGAIARPGVRIPTSREVYEPILDELASLGIAFHEWTEHAWVRMGSRPSSIEVQPCGSEPTPSFSSPWPS